MKRGGDPLSFLWCLKARERGKIKDLLRLSLTLVPRAERPSSLFCPFFDGDAAEAQINGLGLPSLLLFCWTTALIYLITVREARPPSLPPSFLSGFMTSPLPLPEAAEAADETSQIRKEQG